MAKNITATANGTTISGVNVKTIASNLGSPIKIVQYNNVEYWRLAPDYLFNGSIDGQYFKSLTGSNYTNNYGYGYNDGDCKIENNQIMIHCGASSGYENTYGSGNQGVTNLMDLSGCTTLRFKGNLTGGGGGWCHINGYIDLVDDSGKTFNLLTLAKNNAQTNSTWYYDTNEVNIQDSGLNLTSCSIRFRVWMDHYAPWSNWYGGNSYIYITSITTT